MSRNTSSKVATAPGAEADSARERIMKVAAREFSRQGFAGTTIADIADAIGIRSPSIYYHFKDKAAILAAIANMTLDLALTDSKRMVDVSGLTVAQRFYHLVHDLVLHLCDFDYDLDCMFDPAFHQKEFRAVNAKLRAWLGHMEELIKVGVADGIFAPQPVSAAAYSVRGVIIAAIRKPGGYAGLGPRARAEYAGRFAVKGLLEVRTPELD